MQRREMTRDKHTKRNVCKDDALFMTNNITSF